MKTKSPTTHQFNAYQALYDYLNRELFKGELSPCLLNFSRKSGTLGFFSPDRWQSGKARTHEISLNPSHLATRETAQTVSTLVHEMVHLWQHEHGKEKPRAGYHNREWATKMKAVGLIPSDTAAPGGRETGDRVSHYIDPDGRFAKVFARTPKAHLLPWSSFDAPTAAKAKPASKVKYTCSECDANAWGKPGLRLYCGDCSTESGSRLVPLDPAEATG